MPASFKQARSDCYFYNSCNKGPLTLIYNTVQAALCDHIGTDRK
jgi:hypothetical protein